MCLRSETSTPTRLQRTEVVSPLSYLLSTHVSPLLLSVSKSGLDKSLPKNGAGPHNWGSITELTHPYIHHNLDTAKLPPQSQDFKGADDIDLDNVDDDGDVQETEMAASPSTAAALHANGGGDLPKQDKAEEAPAGGKQRRMSSMTDEEREKARAWRHGAMNRDKGQFCMVSRPTVNRLTDRLSTYSRLVFHRANVWRL